MKPGLVGAIAAVLIVMALVGTWFKLSRSRAAAEPVPVESTEPGEPAESIEPVAEPDFASSSINDDMPLTNFAFENLVVGSGVTPDATMTMSRTTAAETNYKLVRCSLVNAYSIVWSGRYATVTPTGELEWSLDKEEPQSCFIVKPGYCGDTGAFIMLQSVFNKHFLRVNGQNKVVAVDGPTPRSTSSFCWLMRSAPSYDRQPCGTVYRPEYGRVVNIPCDIRKMPGQGQNCGHVTQGFMADCCGKRPNDPACRSIYIREVVGRTLAEGSVYLKTRFPDFKVLKCAQGDACESAHPFPIAKPDTIVLVYDKKFGTVVRPAYRFV